MTLVMLCKKACTSRNLLNLHLVRKCKYTVNININTTEKVSTLKNKCAVFITPKRNFFKFFKRPTKKQLHIKDDVPDEYTLIYRNTMDRYISAAQLFSSIGASIVIGGLIINHDFLNSEVDYSKLDYSARSTENEIYVYIATFAALVAILQVLVSRLPLRIYYLAQQKKYRFVFYGNYPFTQRQLTCQAGEVAPLPETRIAPWKQARYCIKNDQKVILMDHYFRRPADLYIMLGVQRDHDVNEEK